MANSSVASSYGSININQSGHLVQCCQKEFVAGLIVTGRSVTGSMRGAGKPLRMEQSKAHRGWGLHSGFHCGAAEAHPQLSWYRMRWHDQHGASASKGERCWAGNTLRQMPPGRKKYRCPYTPAYSQQPAGFAWLTMGACTPTLTPLGTCPPSNLFSHFMGAAPRNLSLFIPQSPAAVIKMQLICG